MAMTKIIRIEDLITMAEIPFYGTNMKRNCNRDDDAKYYREELQSLYKLKSEGITHVKFEHGYLGITF